MIRAGLWPRMDAMSGKVRLGWWTAKMGSWKERWRINYSSSNNWIWQWGTVMCRETSNMPGPSVRLPTLWQPLIVSTVVDDSAKFCWARGVRNEERSE
jgi:hypothetical protein